ncbi:unnamed protein product [Parajaminaea phylloscopi]
MSQPIPTLHRTTPSTSSIHPAPSAIDASADPSALPVDRANLFASSPSKQAFLGTSPGYGSDISNEAVGGHSYSSPPAQTAPLPALHSPSQPAGRSTKDSLPVLPLNAPVKSTSTGISNGPSTSSSTSTTQMASQTTFPQRPSIGSRTSTDERTRPSISTDYMMVHAPSIPSAAPTPTSATATVSAPSPTTPFATSASLNPMHGSASTSKMAVQQQAAQIPDGVPTTFDEATLRALCDTDVGVALLYERIKQSMNSAREAASFFKKRAALEEEYGRSLQKMSKVALESYGSVDGKAGSYVTSYHTILATHEQLAESRLKFAQRLAEMSDELSNLVKEVDRNRKSARDTGSRLERNLLDAEQGVEKARTRFDSAAEDLERLLLLKSGESSKGGELAAQHAATGGSASGQVLASKGRSLGKAMSKGGMQLFKNSKNPQQLLRQEEDVRARTSQLSDTFRREVLQTQQMRQEYFNLQLPRILRSLKETADEIDNGLQFHLSRYAFLYESTLLADGMVVTPAGAGAESGGSTGLKTAAESIDNRTDFKTFMQNYQVLHARDYRGPRREGPYEEGFVNQPGQGAAGHSPSATAPRSAGHTANGSLGGAGPLQKIRPIFGVDLATQMARDNVEVPGILEKCAASVEAFGKENIGIYRLSGTTSKVQRLKAKFDADWVQVDLFEDAEALSDVNIVSGCLKLWFRELPEPLLTWELYRNFVDAAKVDNDRLRHIRLHEVVNQLPDANYSTLKALMGHLDRIRSCEQLNQMSASNLAIVFGPTLLNPPPAGMVFPNQPGAGGEGGTGHANGGVDEGEHESGASGGALQDMAFQSKAVETILIHYADIFLEEEEIEALERQKNGQHQQQEGVDLRDEYAVDQGNVSPTQQTGATDAAPSSGNLR